MNPWHAAGAQLLAYLQRCGITRLPQPHTPLPDAVVAWHESHASPNDVSANDQALLDTSHSNRPLAGPSSSSGIAWNASPGSNPNSLASAVSNAAPTPSASTLASEPVLLPTSSSSTSSLPLARTPIDQLQMAPGPWLTSTRNPEERSEGLRVLADEARACRLCTDLVCRRQQTVFGVGPHTARFVMFGEAPGAEEDRKGEPFVGPAGQLLDKILVATGLDRNQVYIMNALKCRPPNNRTPTDVEIENCRPFFEAQLELLQPEYIVCWGSVAARAVLKTNESIGRLRGRFYRYHQAKVLVTYHPSYLLRTPDAKKLTWQDMNILMRDMGSPPPQ